MDGEPLIEAKGISKDFSSPNGQNLRVLENISVSIYPNEVVGIIGPSGCGKSTFMRILAGLIPKSSGEIFYHGQKHEGLIPEMSMVFQNFALYPWMTVQGNVEMVLKAIHESPAEIEKRTRNAIEMIGLVGFEDAYPREISGGMKQRVGIARAIVRNPETLFLDEPFSALDAFTAESLRSEIIDIWANKELPVQAILLVSHDIQEVAYMADRIVIFGRNPATVRGVWENKLPRPRNYYSPDFLKFVEELHDSYSQMALPRPVPPVEKEKIAPLLYVHLEEIVGLLDYLNLRGGKQDVYKIGAESRVHFDKVAVLLQALELLGFIEISQRTVSITQKGKEYLEASDKDRRKLWREQLLTIPLFNRVYQMLKEAPGHALDRKEIVDVINRELPYQDAYAHFQILSRWGHYGHLFIYHRLTHKLALDKENHKA